MAPHQCQWPKKLTETHTEKAARDWSAAGLSQEMPGATQAESIKEQIPLEPLEGLWPFGHPEFGLLAS